jgi:glutamyl-tRNA reductase
MTGNPADMEVILHALSEWKQIPKEYGKKYCLFYRGQKAVRHLYKVTCGLDSMVLGEDEILRQVKEGYLSADKNGFTNGELNIIFQGAFNCAKLSKSETRLSNTPVSIGTLTANVIEDFQRKNKTATPAVLVIGATGKIGSIVAKDLLAKGIPVIGTRRKRCGAGNLLWQGAAQMSWVEFDRRYEVLSKVSAVVSATESPHYTLTQEEFATNRGSHTYLLVDLAVPHDMDTELREEKDVSLLDIDYFQTLSKENGNIKLGEMEKAERILEECVEEVLKKLYIREFQEEMTDRRQEDWFQKMTFYLRDALDSEQLKAVLEKICEKEKQ